MLIYFDFDARSQEVRFSGGGQSAEGASSDFTSAIGKGQSFGGIAFDEFKTHDMGTVLWDPVKKAGEILLPDSPKWDAILKQAASPKFES